MSLLVLTCLLLAACGLGKDPPQSDEGCGACTEEVAALRAQVAKLDGVSEIAQLSYTEKVTLTTPPTVQTRVTITAAQPARVMDQIAQLAWKSPISALDTVLVEWRGADGIYQRPVFFRFGTDSADYEQRWGARPSGNGS